MWRLEAVPAYVGGEILPDLFNCGSGLADDLAAVTAEDTQMQVIRETSEAEFAVYCNLLEADGFICTFDRKNGSGLYRQYQKENNLVYTYFTYCDRTARVLADKASVPLPDFEDIGGKALHMDTSLMQFGLLYDDMVKWTSCDCGMNYVLRLHNNKLIVVDGGEAEQATEIAVGEWMKRVRTLTQTNEGDPIEIALWFCTHPHDDHMDFFVKLIRKYGALLHLERVMFNFPSGSLLSQKPYVRDLRGLLCEKYPDVRFLKPHTGQRFTIDSAVFDVLYTQEDLLSTKTDDLQFHGANETSAVVKIEFENRSLLLLADAGDEVEEIVCARYASDGLSCTFLQAAHHCINTVEGLYAFIQSDYVLIPESRYNIHKRFRHNYNVICKYNDPEKVILAGDYTSIFHVCDGEMRMEYFPVRGCLYDGT